MGPFEVELETVYTEGILDSIRAIVARLLSPLRSKLNQLLRLKKPLEGVEELWLGASEDSGQMIPRSPAAVRAMSIVDLIKSRDTELEVRRFVSDNSLRVIPESYNLREDMGVSSIIGLTLGAIGGLPLMLKGLSKLCGILRLRSIQRAVDECWHVLHLVEMGTLDVVIPDRLSYAVYRRAWNRGFKATGILLTFDEYRHSKAREKTESVLYSLLLVYFAIHGLLGVLHYGVSLLGSAEASATAVKGVEIARGVGHAGQIVRGEL